VEVALAEVLCDRHQLRNLHRQALR